MERTVISKISSSSSSNSTLSITRNNTVKRLDDGGKDKVDEIANFYYVKDDDIYHNEEKGVIINSRLSPTLIDTKYGRERDRPTSSYTLKSSTSNKRGRKPKLFPSNAAPLIATHAVSSLLGTSTPATTTPLPMSQSVVTKQPLQPQKIPYKRKTDMESAINLEKEFPRSKRQRQKSQRKQASDDEDFWNVGFQIMLRWGQEKGHCNVPKGVVFEDFPLGDWVATLQSNLANGVLSSKQENELFKHFDSLHWSNCNNYNNFDLYTSDYVEIFSEDEEDDQYLEELYLKALQQEQEQQPQRLVVSQGSDEIMYDNNNKYITYNDRNTNENRSKRIRKLSLKLREDFIDQNTIIIKQKENDQIKYNKLLVKQEKLADFISMFEQLLEYGKTFGHSDIPLTCDSTSPYYCIAKFNEKLKLDFIDRRLKSEEERIVKEAYTAGRLKWTIPQERADLIYNMKLVKFVCTSRGGRRSRWTRQLLQESRCNSTSSAEIDEEDVPETFSKHFSFESEAQQKQNNFIRSISSISSTSSTSSSSSTSRSKDPVTDEVSKLLNVKNKNKKGTNVYENDDENNQEGRGYPVVCELQADTYGQGDKKWASFVKIGKKEYSVPGTFGTLPEALLARDEYLQQKQFGSLLQTQCAYIVHPTNNSEIPAYGYGVKQPLRRHSSSGQIKDVFVDEGKDTVSSTGNTLRNVNSMWWWDIAYFKMK